MNGFKIAIDGPAGSGKSTISKLLAKRLGYTHIDTGAMYRALTVEALRRKIDLLNEKEYDFLDDVLIEYKGESVFLNGEDVTKEIRDTKVTNNVSSVAKVKSVRDNMKLLQRKAAVGNIIMDGRDIGYNVLPDADLKIFLVASIDERAKRRLKELSQLENNLTLEAIKEDIIKRDYEDSNRAVSPLKKADDAIIVDTTYLDIEGVVNKIIELIEEKQKG